MPGYRALQLLLDFGRGAERRQSALLRIRASASLFQPFGTTWPNRYPRIFAELRDRLGQAASVRLLSFGCSTGEEVASLRAHFPNAFIKGVDISPERIAICRGRLLDAEAGRTQFEIGVSVRGEDAAVYDAVLAMAVFRHGQLGDYAVTENRLLDFDRFERAVTDLARTVRPGGYFVLRHSNFRFTDTAVAAEFETVGYAQCVSPLFDRSGARLPDQAREAALFHKR